MFVVCAFIDSQRVILRVFLNFLQNGLLLQKKKKSVNLSTMHRGPRDMSKISWLGTEMFIPIYMHLLSLQHTTHVAPQKLEREKSLKSVYLQLYSLMYVFCNSLLLR